MSAGVAVFFATRSRGRHAASCQPPRSTNWSQQKSNTNQSEPGCCGCFRKVLTERGVYVHNLLRLIGRSPRQQRTLRHRGLRKLALNSGTTRRSAKNAQPYIATEPSLKAPCLCARHLQQETQSTTCTTGTSTPCVSTATADAAVFCTDNPKHLALDATGMSTALSKNCTCGSTAQAGHLHIPA